MHDTLRNLAATALLAGTLGLVGCDVTDPLEGVKIRIEVPDAPVELASGQGTVAVRAGEASLQSTTVANNSDIQEIEVLRVIRFQPSFFSFTGSAGFGSGASALLTATGEVQFLLVVGGIPVPGMPIVVSVVNDRVTAVTPSSIDLESPSYNKPMIESLFAKSGRSLPNGWASLTPQAAVQQISKTLAQQSIPLDIIVFSENLTGSLNLSKFTIDARVNTTAKN